MPLALERTLGPALVSALLALPSVAVAGKPADPGAHGNAKNDVPTEPAPDPAPVDQPAPAKTEPIKPVKVEGEKPVTQGTLKKAPASTTTTQAPTSTQAAPTRRRSSSRGTARSTTRSNRGGATRGTARADRVRALNAEERAERREQAAAAVERRAAARRARRERERRAAVAAATASDEDEADGGLVGITRAAEEVVEVIPGAILLAMTGMGGLVMLLVVRSWVTERRRGKALTESYAVTVQALATAIEAKDHTTGGHIERVRDLGLMLARELDLRDMRDPQMAYGFLLHDVGKLSVPDSILRHPGPLDPDGWAVMQRHPDEGVRILREIPFLDRALDVVRYHHERWDGTGYPEGLKGEEIPLWARIFAVVDALDAMTADRPYRAAMSYEDALAEIRSSSGTQFDPRVVETLERVDAAEVQCLLEPAQKCDSDAPDGALEPLEAMLAAAGRARGEPMPVNGNGVPLAELGEMEPAPRSNTAV